MKPIEPGSNSPSRLVVLYDGHCRFCCTGAAKLAAWARAGTVELRDFQERGVLNAFPTLTHEACMRQLHLVKPVGQVYGGLQAIVEALATRPLLRRLPALYALPGIRQLLDWLYRLIAANRYRLMGRKIVQGTCEGGTCHLHFGRTVQNDGSAS